MRGLIGSPAYWGPPIIFSLGLLWAIGLALFGAGFDRVRWVHLLAWGVFLAAEALAVEVVWEAWHIWMAGGALPRQFSGWLGQSNHLASMLLLGLVSAGWCVLWTARRWLRIAVLMGALPLLGVLPLTGSRTGLINGVVLVVLGGASWIFAQYRAAHAAKPKALWLFIAGAAVATLFIAEPRILSDVTEKQVSGIEARTGGAGFWASLRLRTDEWRKSELMLRDHPLGVGIGEYGGHSFEWQLNPPFSETPREQVYSNAHNLFAQVAAELGWPGLLLLLTGIAAWVWEQLRAPVTAERVYGWAFLSVIFVHSMLEYPLWYAYFLGPFALAFGMTQDERRTSGFVLRLSPWLVAIIGGVGIAAWGVAAYGQWQVDRGYGLWGEGKSRAAIASAHEAIKTVLLAPDGEQLLNYLDDAEQAGLAEKQARNRRLLRWRPYASIVYRQAILSAQAGDVEAAKIWLLKGLEVYPSKRSYYNNLYERTKSNVKLKVLDQAYSAMLVQRRLARNVGDEEEE